MSVRGVEEAVTLALGAEESPARKPRSRKESPAEYGVVADRLAERFIRPLAIDRVRALVAPAVEEARAGGPAPKFELLQQDTEYLTREPTGVGLDVPAWLVALEEEVDAVLQAYYQGSEEGNIAEYIAPILLSYDEARQKLDHWASRQE
jgi:hypothetical protein